MEAAGFTLVSRRGRQRAAAAPACAVVAATAHATPREAAASGSGATASTAVASAAVAASSAPRRRAGKAGAAADAARPAPSPPRELAAAIARRAAALAGLHLCGALRVALAHWLRAARTHARDLRSDTTSSSSSSCGCIDLVAYGMGACFDGAAGGASAGWTATAGGNSAEQVALLLCLRAILCELTGAAPPPLAVDSEADAGGTPAAPLGGGDTAADAADSPPPPPPPPRDGCPAVRVSCYDPVLTLDDRALYAHLGVAVIATNEGCARRVRTCGGAAACCRCRRGEAPAAAARCCAPLLAFMPHCDAQLYEAILAANRGDLPRLAVLGNSFAWYHLSGNLQARGPAGSSAGDSSATALPLPCPTLAALATRVRSAAEPAAEPAAGVDAAPSCLDAAPSADGTAASDLACGVCTACDLACGACTACGSVGSDAAATPRLPPPSPLDLVQPLELPLPLDDCGEVTERALNATSLHTFLARSAAEAEAEAASAAAAAAAAHPVARRSRRTG